MWLRCDSGSSGEVIGRWYEALGSEFYEWSCGKMGGSGGRDSGAVRAPREINTSDVGRSLEQTWRLTCKRLLGAIYTEKGEGEGMDGDLRESLGTISLFWRHFRRAKKTQRESIDELTRNDGKKKKYKPTYRIEIERSRCIHNWYI